MKNTEIILRVDEEFKKRFADKAKSLGMSLASYIRMVLIKSLD